MSVDKELQRRTDRLCQQYRQTSAELFLLQPSKRPKTRKQRRLEGQARNLLGTLRDVRETQSSALVRLAYVRGMRSVVPEMRLDSTQQAEVSTLQRDLSHELSKVESGQLLDFRNRIRRLILADAMERNNVPEVMVDAVMSMRMIYPLEQRARVSVQVAVDLAYQAGMLAAKRSHDYDTRDAA